MAEKKLKVAIVHDYIKEYGGAERVLESLHEVYPDAPVYTSVFIPSFLGPHRERFEKWEIKTSFLQYLPLKHKLLSPFRILAPLVFSAMDFSAYDVIIVSATGAYTPNTIRKGNAIQVCYCHTPPRYLYGYATARNWKNNLIFRTLGEIANHFLRMVDYKSAQNVDYFIANSAEVAGRIEKFYRKQATVIYPPVQVKSIKRLVTGFKKKKYYLAGGRLARAKRIDLAVKAFNTLGYKLKIFGRDFAGYEGELKKISQSNIQFLGEVDEKTKYELMAKAKAFIFPSQDEDFGITPVEAMACGTAVIAFRGGGVLETVIDGKTGIFFEKLSTKSIIRAVHRLEKTNITADACQEQAKKFGKARFKKEIRNFVNDKRKV